MTALALPITFAAAVHEPCDKRSLLEGVLLYEHNNPIRDHDLDSQITRHGLKSRKIDVRDAFKSERCVYLIVDSDNEAVGWVGGTRKENGAGWNIRGSQDPAEFYKLTGLAMTKGASAEHQAPYFADQQIYTAVQSGWLWNRQTVFRPA